MPVVNWCFSVHQLRVGLTTYCIYELVAVLLEAVTAKATDSKSGGKSNLNLVNVSEGFAKLLQGFPE